MLEGKEGTPDICFISPPLREGRRGPGAELGGRGASLSGGEDFGLGIDFQASEVSNAIAEDSGRTGCSASMRAQMGEAQLTQRLITTLGTIGSSGSSTRP